MPQQQYKRNDRDDSLFSDLDFTFPDPALQRGHFRLCLLWFRNKVSSPSHRNWSEKQRAVKLKQKMVYQQSSTTASKPTSGNHKYHLHPMPVLSEWSERVSNPFNWFVHSNLKSIKEKCLDKLSCVNVSMDCILGDVWISEVAEHSLVCCVGEKSLKLTDLHLCDGQACRGRRQLHTKNI